MSTATATTARLWNCDIEKRPGDPPLFTFERQSDGTLRPTSVNLTGYRIVPASRDLGPGHIVPIAGCFFRDGSEVVIAITAAAP